MNLRQINRALHRDFGYFFTGMIIIYSLSGIALNHKKDWNPNYSIERSIHQVQVPTKMHIQDETVLALLESINKREDYRKYYFPSEHELKVFFKSGGNATVNLTTGELVLEDLTKRQVFHQFNFLHYNPGNLWIWFSDIFCVALILLSIGGLFILKGKNSISGRGAWLTSAGFVIPLILLFLYY
jgi:hypothetical protein